jgi:hypothetical protein
MCAVVLNERRLNCERKLSSTSRDQTPRMISFDSARNNQLSTINCFNEEETYVGACVLALCERRIKREAKLVLKCDSSFNESHSEWSDWGERHSRWVGITTWEECCSGRAPREPAEIQFLRLTTFHSLYKESSEPSEP